MVRRRRNSGSETMPPKKLRSPVSFGIFSKRNRGTFFFAACLANPELRLKHLRAPRDRPRHARHATEVLFLLRYSSVPAAGAGPPWLLRLLRARSKGSRRHAAPRVGISDRGIISGVPHHRKRSPSPGPNRNDTSIAVPQRPGGMHRETLGTSGCTQRVQERSLLAPRAARLSLQAQPAGQDAGETRACRQAVARGVSCFRCRPPKNGVPGFSGAGRQKNAFPDNPSVCYADTSPYTGEGNAAARFSKRLPLLGSWLAAGQTDEVL
jgi:hypothetical protein